jgi:hypothetical protein
MNPAEPGLSIPPSLTLQGRVFDLRSRGDRARVYEIVLQEGRPADILAYVDGALLADLWDDLVLPRAVRSASAPSGLAVRRAGVMTAGDGQPGLPPFQLEVARMFFAMPASRGFLLAGELPCSHSTLRKGPPRTSTSSPPLSAGMFPPLAMPRRQRPASEAGLPSGSTIVTRSAEWSSAALTAGS